ncbi:MAG: ferritin [Actinomycetota bacterium]|nr:ferritin [Actinomycetota bacterium]
MAENEFTTALNKQIGNELAAAHQYMAAAVYYDSETLPQLAGFFYRQALEERNHAMMMVQFLVDTDEQAVIPGVEAPKMDFSDIVGPVSMALEQEKQVGAEIDELFKLARESGYFQGEQFLQWFIKEQVEEVASMTDLLAVVERAKNDPLHGEEYLARQQIGDDGDDPSAPTVAGGAL